MANNFFYYGLRRWLAGLVVFIAALGVLRFKPWQYQGIFNLEREELKVGFLPVT